MLASWNIANLGVHIRKPRDYRLMAELLSWFDIACIQEVNDDLSGLRAIEEAMGGTYRVLFSDKAGNNERMAVIYDSAKLRPGELAAEIAVPAADKRHIRIDGIAGPFLGFDRNPHVLSLDVGTTRLTLVNVHLYFGGSSTDRRVLEAYAVGRWADLRAKSGNAYGDVVYAVGDFNIPKVGPGDAIYRALTKRGLRLPIHSGRIASAIATDNQYDQIAFTPGAARQALLGTDVFDYDGAVFAKVWKERTKAEFRGYLRYYMSDHRPVWAEIAV